MISDWPVYTKDWAFDEEEAMVERAKDLVRGMRTLRTDMDVPPSRKAKIFVTSANAQVRDIFTKVRPVYEGLAGATEVVVQEGKDGIDEKAVSVVIPDAVLYVPLEDLVDFEKEKERLNKEKAKLEKELARSKGMLSNEKFLSKAPEAKVAEEKAKLEKYEQMMAQVQERLKALGC
jgi:valyl-tRNA synthetase